MMDDDVAIRVQDLSKTFKLPHEKNSSIKGAIVNFRHRDRSYELQETLRNLSFEINKGEFFGIVGRNGSGKSTLLKLLAGIYTPTQGTVQVNGKLTPFIELGVGFSPELTGRENVFLNGSLLGFSRKEMTAMYEDIVSFAELERFMDQKLKNYSSGMQVRLAFSIAIRAQGDILLLDEVLAVGDEAFQRKCYEYFGNLKKSNRTVVLVSHDMGVVERYCKRAMLIEKGKVVSIGESTDVAQMYKDLFMKDVFTNTKADPEARAGIKNKDLAGFKLSFWQDAKEVAFVDGNKPFTIRATISAARHFGKSAIGIEIVNEEITPVLSLGSGGVSETPLSISKGEGYIEFEMLENVLNNGPYMMSVTLQTYDDNDNEIILYQRMKAKRFVVRGLRGRQHAMVHANYKASYRHGD